MIISTTPQLEGYQILKYIKPVTTNIVIGTNALSDLAASFTDLFGGASTSYENKLTKMSSSVINAIKAKAIEANANAIVGLRIDFDEISGKDKSMFMVTATGTAVFVKETKNTVDGESISQNLSINFIREQRDRKSILSAAKSNSKPFVPNLEKITELKVHEVGMEVLYYCEKSFTDMNQSKPKIRHSIKEYFNSIGESKTLDFAYKYLLENRSLNFQFDIIDILSELNYIDLEAIISHTNNLDSLTKVKLLELANIDKPYYSTEDTSKLEKLKAVIIDKYPLTSTASSKKGFLSSKETDVWICQCNTTNDIYQDYCSKCELDQYGCPPNKINPPKLIEKINSTIEIIKECKPQQ